MKNFSFYFGPLFMLAMIFAFAGGCFTPAQRDQAILDLQAAHGIVTDLFPAGATRDKYLKLLDDATTVEQRVQVIDQARRARAAGTQPSAN